MIQVNKRKYDETIAILRNTKQLPSIFIELKDFIYQQFKVTAINFLYEKIKFNNPENRYSLEILLLNNGDYQKMCDGLYKGYNKEKQEVISDEFCRLAQKYSFDIEAHLKNIWVCYTDFNNEVRAETNNSASKEAIAFIKKQYPLLPIWQICPMFSSVVIFYEADMQVKENDQNGFNELLKQEYFTVLKKYDEFDLFDYDNFCMSFDSKEIVDKEYSGSLFYYFK